jgi:amino acid transporter
MGNWGVQLVIFGALLATSSAISGTLFGASRLMTVIAHDGYLPASLSRRRNHIPVNAIICMSLFAYVLILAGDLESILEFGSITFLLVSILMAFANYKIRHLTRSSLVITVISILGLLFGAFFVLYYEFDHQPEKMYSIIGLYLLLTAGSWLYSRRKH